MKKIHAVVLALLGLSISGCASNPMTQQEFEACLFNTSMAGVSIGSIGSIPGAVGGTLAGVATGFVVCDRSAQTVVSEPAVSREPVAEETGSFWLDDQDGDKVRDASDRCPFTPADIIVDADGCALDGDADGVPDYIDQCLVTVANAVVDTDGCSMMVSHADTMGMVLFSFDSVFLTADSKAKLDSIAKTIKERGSEYFDIVGHADSEGSDTYNRLLSTRRAQVVHEYLISNGISSNRLHVNGKGEAEPIASNDTKAGMKQNRRVEILAR